MSGLEKQELVNLFLQGQSVSSLARRYHVETADALDIIREAIKGLSRLIAARASVSVN